MEQRFFFENNGYNIFGILLSPEGKNLDTGFVFCYPFAPEGIYRRIYTAFARRLTSIGYYVLCFNYMGTGDSSGDFEDTTVETYISDVFKAVNILQEKSNIHNIGLFGIKLGATLAGITATNPEIKIETLVLWDPILDIKKYINDCLRQSITFQNVLFHKIIYNRNQIIEKLISEGKAEHNGYFLNFIEGYVISRALYTQLVELDLPKQIKCFSRNMLIIQTDEKKDQPIAELQELVKLCKQNGGSAELLQVNKPAPWITSASNKWISEQNQIFDITERWIQKSMKKDKL